MLRGLGPGVEIRAGEGMAGRPGKGPCGLDGKLGVDLQELAGVEEAPPWVGVHRFAGDDQGCPRGEVVGPCTDAGGSGVQREVCDRAPRRPGEDVEPVGGGVAEGPQSLAVVSRRFSE